MPVSALPSPSITSQKKTCRVLPPAPVCCDGHQKPVRSATSTACLSEGEGGSMPAAFSVSSASASSEPAYGAMEIVTVDEPSAEVATSLPSASFADQPSGMSTVTAGAPLAG